MSNKDCKYPQREKKVTLLESQLNKIRAKILHLEAKLKEKEFKGEDLVESEFCVHIDDQIRVEPLKREKYPNDIDDAINPFNSTSNVIPSRYFGTSSGQTFDSELKSYLFEITHEAQNMPSLSQQRHFFKDPTLDSPFLGVVMLPDKESAILLVEKVIMFIGHEYYLFDSNKFFKQIDEAYEKLRDKKPLWLCYFLMTLAVGEQYLNHSPNGEIPGMGFYMAAMRLYKSSYEEPTLEFVQMLLLIAFYLQGLNSGNAAFSFYGLASRSALIQGLHRNIPSILSSEKEKRKRLWWTVFVMESMWCSNLGHPIHVEIDDVDVDFPEENEVDLGDHFNRELLGYNVKLATITGCVMKEVYSPTKGSTSIKIKKMLDCLEKLDDFQKILPPRIKNNLILSDNRSTANLYLRLNQNIIVTTRPLLLSLFKGHIQSTETVRKVISQSVNAAKLTIDILFNLKNNDWLSTFGFWDAQFCFSALLILIICSFSGNHYPQTKIGRMINRFMKDAGNFTALDNENRLMELDELLTKIPHDSRHSEQGDAELIDNQELVRTALNSEHQVENQNIKNGLDTSAINNLNELDGTMAKDIDEAKSNENTRNGIEYFANQLDHPPANIPLDNASAVNYALDYYPDSQNSDSVQIGDFSSFRNNVSPNTWSELTANLKFWDSPSL